MRPLDEQTILVTGSADGLGRHVAAELAAGGASVLVHGRDPAKVERVAADVGAAGGLVADLASLGQAPLAFDNLMLESGYDMYPAYAQSKLAQILFTFELAERLREREVTVNALHPATFMDTKMVRESMGRGGRPASSVEEGAEATLRLVAGPSSTA